MKWLISHIKFFGVPMHCMEQDEATVTSHYGTEYKVKGTSLRRISPKMHIKKNREALND